MGVRRPITHELLALFSERPGQRLSVKMIAVLVHTSPRRVRLELPLLLEKGVVGTELRMSGEKPLTYYYGKSGRAETLHALIDRLLTMPGIDFQIIQHNSLEEQEKRTYEIRLATISRFFRGESPDLDIAAGQVLEQIAKSESELSRDRTEVAS